ncbi:MAG: hypothetical protein AAFV53_14955, partial [Myxococcota bacterium]
MLEAEPIDADVDDAAPEGDRSGAGADRCHPDQDPPTALPADPPPPIAVSSTRQWLAALSDVAMKAAWYSRHPRSPFALSPERPPERLYYTAADGWENVLFRYPPREEDPGEPLILAHGMGLGPVNFGLLGAGSIAHAAHQAGFDVFLFTHRGDRGALPPRDRRRRPPRRWGFDFDDIVEHDVPAALEKVRQVTEYPRAIWAGHGMGGQLLYATMARFGDAHLAAGISLCAAARFQAPRSHARLAATVAKLLPLGWNLPTRSLNRVLAPISDEHRYREWGADLSGEATRGVMAYGVEDVPAGLLRQLARWVAAGELCDRHDRIAGRDPARAKRAKAA